MHTRFKELLHMRSQLENRVEDLRKELAARQNHSETPRVPATVL